MALGCVMKFTVNGLQVELAPFTREEVAVFAEGFSSLEVVRYISFQYAQTKETEQAWYDKMIQDKQSLVWGIWVVEGGMRKLIGNTALTDISKGHTIQATSGSVIADRTYWGKGVASACHKARTWYAFRHMGMTRVKSAVLQPNIGSRKALERSGYTLVYTERNEQFVDGQLVHKDCVECINPSPAAWRLWWGSDTPNKRAREARKVTQEALAWADQHVLLG